MFQAYLILTLYSCVIEIAFTIYSTKTLEKVGYTFSKEKKDVKTLVKQIIRLTGRLIMPGYNIWRSLKILKNKLWALEVRELELIKYGDIVSVKDENEIDAMSNEVSFEEKVQEKIGIIVTLRAFINQEKYNGYEHDLENLDYLEENFGLLITLHEQDSAAALSDYYYLLKLLRKFSGEINHSLKNTKFSLDEKNEDQIFEDTNKKSKSKILTKKKNNKQK